MITLKKEIIEANKVTKKLDKSLVSLISGFVIYVLPATSFEILS